MFRIILSFMLIQYSSNASANEYIYKVEENDQLGVILLSLGHLYLWPNDGKINQFIKSSNLKKSENLKVTDTLIFSDSEIIFKENVNLKDGYLFFRQKIRTRAQYYKYLKNRKAQNFLFSEKKTPVDVLPVEFKSVSIDSEIISSHKLKIYMGLGFFSNNNEEKHQELKISTRSGIQPIIQVKGIYDFGSITYISVNLLTKKIINNKYDFPIDIDYRIHMIPKLQFISNLHFAISHSFLRHSYVGKTSSSVVESSQTLNSSFIGLGLVYLSTDFNLEIYGEKAYTGFRKSSGVTYNTSNGLRFDSELTYPLTNKWTIMPGINYLTFKNNKDTYNFFVTEARLTLSYALEI